MCSAATNVVHRAAMEVSRDDNFNEIYNVRYKKYCLLLSKEKEYLRQLEGQRRRSSTFNREQVNFENWDQYRRGSFPKQHNATLSNYHNLHSTSLTDMRKTPKIILSSHHGRKLSTSYEDITDTDYIDANDRRRAFSRVSQETFYTNKNQYDLLRNRSDSNIAHRHHSRSCENLLNFNNTSSNNVSYNDMNNNTSNDITKRIYLRDNIMTSSTQNLSERNVRNIDRHDITKHLSNTDLKRRVIEAKVKQRKRGEKLKELDDDFNKAREIMQKYKSNDSLNNIRLTSIENNHNRNSWIT